MKAYFNHLTRGKGKSKRTFYGIGIQVAKKEYKILNKKSFMAMTKESIYEKPTRPMTFSVNKDKKPYNILFTPETKSYKKIKKINVTINENYYKKLGNKDKPYIRFEQKIDNEPVLVQIEISEDALD